METRERYRYDSEVEADIDTIMGVCFFPSSTLFAESGRAKCGVEGIGDWGLIERRARARASLRVEMHSSS